jgi:endonuclease/exonuclease/phosphatase family metal-dependent hydrolase
VMEATGLARQVARTPIVALFDFADQRLRLANAHIVFGGTGSERDIETAREFDAIVRVLRASGDRQGADATILLGDLNFQGAEVPQVDLAGQSGFRFPAGLLAAGSAAFSDKPYDQILTDWDPKAEPPGVAASGVFAIFDHVYRDTDFDLYRDRLEAAWPDEPDRLERRYLTFWRTWRISDHRPKWIELDFGEGR